MKLRTALSAALAGLMTLSSLAACGEQADAAAEPAATAAPESAAAQTEQETTTDYLSTLPEADMGGRTFTIVAQHTAERFNFSYEEKTGDVINDSILERDNKVEELLNVKFSRIGYEDRGKLKTDVQKTILAGENAYDMIITSMSDGINTLGPAGCRTSISPPSGGTDRYTTTCSCSGISCSRPGRSRPAITLRRS